MTDCPDWLEDTTELRLETAEQLRRRWLEAHSEVERLLKAVERLIETPARGAATSRAEFYRSLEPLEAALAQAEAELFLIERLIEEAVAREKLSVN